LTLPIALLLTAIVYIRGWLKIRKSRPRQFTVYRLLSFLAGLAVLQLAIGPPMDDLADELLSAHMVEHLLIMSAVPPLLLLGLPVVPLLRGFPVPLIRIASLRRLGHWLVKPPLAWLLMNVTFLAWHVPAAYDFALENETWHVIEHICFLATSILFWWCVLRPWPAPQRNNRWGILLFLLSADVVNTLLSAFLAFCGRPVYAFYVEHPNPYRIAPLQDQVLGAVIMWVFGSLAFVIPAVAITVRLLTPRRQYESAGSSANLLRRDPRTPASLSRSSPH
jgi:cytochrome c oxidase assembly factor CtaG